MKMTENIVKSSGKVMRINIVAHWNNQTLQLID